MIIKNGSVGGIPNASRNPFLNGEITFDGPWQVGWEIYDGKLYAEAVIVKSGTLTVQKQYICDLWMIGGGGGSATMTSSYYDWRAGGGSGFTEAAIGKILGIALHPVTIGAGGANRESYKETNYSTDVAGTQGGKTSMLGVSANGGNPGKIAITNEENQPHTWSIGTGGSNGGTAWRTSVGGSMTAKQAPGENGTPGAGKIMSRFWDATKNTDYGRANGTAAQGAGWGLSGAGYGAGGTSGALVIRIAI